jgi:hypothetical protein
VSKLRLSALFFACVVLRIAANHPQQKEGYHIGTPVTVIADASTGSITFDFGGFILTGTGSITIRHQ